MELRHGYTLSDVHDMARLATHTAGGMGMDWHERYEIAHSAIAEALYDAEHWPPRHDLVRTGQRAIWATVSDYHHHHGFYRHKTIGSQAGPGSSPAFATFWGGHRVTESCEHSVVERLTVHQIWPTLTDRQRAAISALAALDNYRAAAAALGIRPQTFRSLLGRARQEFFARWHEGEAPSRPWGTDRRVLRYEEAA